MILHHLLELVIGLNVLGFQLCRLDSKRFLHFLHLSHSLCNLVEANIDVELLLLQSASLLIVEFDKVLDKVKEVSRSNCHDMTTSLDNLGVDLVKGLMDKDHSIDHRVPVLRWHAEQSAGHWEVIWSSPGRDIKVHLDGELSSNLEEGVV